MKKDGFKCQNCGAQVKMEAIGTKNRNHCPVCLWSVHLDESVPGDRASVCKGLMEPVGLVFKGGDGELMLVHRCASCAVESRNRIAGDDDEQVVIKVFESCTGKDQFLDEDDRFEVFSQLYGKVEAQERLNLPK